MTTASHLVIIQPSSFCNLDCKYCYVPNRHIKDRIAESTLRNIFQKVLSYGGIHNCVGFLWHIGEPLAVGIEFYEQVLRMIPLYNYYGLSTIQMIQTNAMLIDDRWCDLFKAHHFSVSVSVDGPDFLHDDQRIDRKGRPTHAKVMQGVETLKKNNIDYSSIMVLTDKSLDHPETILDFFIDNGFTKIAFNVDEVSSQYPQNSFGGKAFAHMQKRYQQFVERLYDHWIKRGHCIGIREFETTLTTIQRKKNQTNYVKHCQDKKGMRILTIQSNGDISTYSPELASGFNNDLQKFVIGNINKIHSIESLFQNANYQSITHKIETGIKRCREQCAYFDLCGGGEPCVKFYEGGDFDVTETAHCRLMHQCLVDTLIKKVSAHE